MTVRDVVFPAGRQALYDKNRYSPAIRANQGIGNALIDRPPAQAATGPIRRRQRVGGVLSYYYRAAA